MRMRIRVRGGAYGAGAGADDDCEAGGWHCGGGGCMDLGRLMSQVSCGDSWCK